MPSPEEIEKALGQGEGETGTDDPVARNRQSATSQQGKPTSGLLLPKDAVAYCNVSRSQFYVWVGSGYLKRIKIGRYVRYSIKALDEMLKNFEQKNVREPRHKRRMRRTVLP
jgi:predicted DNA-binding transcriptional regulator AlpA